AKSWRGRPGPPWGRSDLRRCSHPRGCRAVVRHLNMHGHAVWQARLCTRRVAGSGEAPRITRRLAARHRLRVECSSRAGSRAAAVLAPPCDKASEPGDDYVVASDDETSVLGLDVLWIGVDGDALVVVDLNSDAHR